ncbi:hypothetical protein AXF42_Ash001422 [Apostasia shenzhenica]|uniref:Uncharacterized protein n=1 Tax=Apostasia shenzhenica TaxID=1088818 RepID=A0A2I0AUW6_9ASPA|nr:hypothetical protein AXF42_Ash001422 [Apostasia shenzhenica]
MVGQDTLKSLERLKGQSWPLKDFLRYVRNDVSLHAKASGYHLQESHHFSRHGYDEEARRGQPPVTQLSRERTEVEEEVIEVSEPVCGGIAVNVISFPEDAADDRKTLAELGHKDGGAKGDDKRLTVVTMPTANKSCVYRGEVGLALGSGLVSKDLEEKLEKTSTLDLYSGFANRIATILARLPVALNRALRTKEQVLEQGRQLHQWDEEVEALRVQLAMKSSQFDAAQKEKTKLQEELGAVKADNKALREKLVKVAEDQEAIVAERSTAAVEAYTTSLPCRQERLDGIRRAWEGLASTLIQGDKITAVDLGEVDSFPCMASDPIYKEEGFDLTDDLIHRVFDLFDGVNES